MSRPTGETETLRRALLRVYDLSMADSMTARLDIREVARAATKAVHGQGAGVVSPRTKTFHVMVKVSNEVIRESPAILDDVRRMLVRKASADLRGPRGGRYVPVSEPYDFCVGERDDDWMRNERSFTARVQARYVRPVA